MRTKGIGTLIPTVVLCTPSLLGGGAMLANSLLRQPMPAWTVNSAALIALGVILGGPLVAISTIVGVIVGFSRRVPQQIKLAHLVIVTLAAVCTLVLLVRFRV